MLLTGRVQHHHNGPSGQIRTCAKCLLRQITSHSCLQNAVEAAAGLQPIAAPQRALARHR